MAQCIRSWCARSQCTVGSIEHRKNTGSGLCMCKSVCVQVCACLYVLLIGLCLRTHSTHRTHCKHHIVHSVPTARCAPFADAATITDVSAGFMESCSARKLADAVSHTQGSRKAPARPQLPAPCVGFCLCHQLSVLLAALPPLWGRLTVFLHDEFPLFKFAAFSPLQSSA